MRPIVDEQGRPLVPAARRPIQARHVTRQAIWTQEAHRALRAEHDDDGHHDTSMHVLGIAWIDIPPTVEAPLKISRSSFWKHRRQSDSSPPWSGTAQVADRSWAKLNLSGDGIPGEVGIVCKTRDLKDANRTWARRLTSTEIEVYVKPGEVSFTGWIMVTVYGGYR